MKALVNRKGVILPHYDSFFYELGLGKCWELMAMFYLLKVRTSIDIFSTESVKLLLALSIYSRTCLLVLFEPRCEKPGLRDFRPGLTQTWLYSHTRWLEGGNFVFRNDTNLL